MRPVTYNSMHCTMVPGGGGSNIFLGVSLPFLCSVLGFQFLYGSKPGFFPEMEGYTAPPCDFWLVGHQFFFIITQPRNGRCCSLLRT